ncbi:BREX system P-loop protein BrxC [Myxococcota bacterium]
MKIRDIFERDIERQINGVVKAGDVDNTVIWTELDEFILTRELDKHLRKFLDRYTASLHHPTDDMGVWVSGFFGSGKSHFIKILSYLLEKKAPTHPQTGAKKDAVSFFEAKVKDKALFGDIVQALSKPTDVILFNIDAKADAKWGDDALLQVFLRVFNEHQRFCPEYPHIAFLERMLQKEGVLDVFEKTFAEASGGKEWKKERQAWRFHQKAMRAALAGSLKQDEAETESWLKKSEAEFVVSPERFGQWVEEYLEEKGPDHRIVFFADEVGQFIGDNSRLMLNLQTITEELGSRCRGRAWVVVTSQEDIDAVLGQFRSVKEQDFSKIQGRFKTRLSLSSSNTDEVIGIRLLEKKEDAKPILNDVFAKQGDILKNQLTFTGTKKKFATYEADSDFAANYPFAPFHFELVQKIFEAIRRAGATGVHLAQGERSMLDGFQTAALAIKDAGIGAIVPLHRFYPAIESFLDTAVCRTIDQAADNPALKGDPRAVELLRTLFLIRYVDVMPGNVDNLVTLSLSEIDQDKLALRKEIESSLDLLEGQNLISRNGDLYAFLTSEEQDVGREIKRMELTPSEENQKIASLIFRDVLEDKTKHKFKDTKKDFAFSRYCDGHFVGSAKEQDVVISVITPFIDSYASFTPTVCLNQSTEHGGQLLLKLPDKKDVLREVQQFLKTDKYIKQKTDDANPKTLKDILRLRAEENRERDGRLREAVREMLLDAEIFADGQTPPIDAKSGQQLLADGMDYVIRNTFNKMTYLSHPSSDAATAEKEVKAVLSANDVQQVELDLGDNTPNAKAIDDVRQFIQLKSGKSHQVVLSELVERYEGRPYGWPTYDIVLIVARLLVAGEVTAKKDAAALAPPDAVESFTKRSKWSGVSLRKRKATSGEIVKEARELGKDLFEKMSTDGESEVAAFLRENLGTWRDSFLKLHELVKNGQYPGAQVVEGGLELVDNLLHFHDVSDFLEQVTTRKQELLELRTSRQDVVGFFETQREIWDELRSAVQSKYKANMHVLVQRSEAKKAIDNISSILGMEAPYGQLHQASGLLQTLSKANDTAIAEMRPECVAKVEAAIGYVTAAIAEAEKKAGKKVPSDVTNKALHGLQELFKAAKESSEIPTIADAAVRSDDAMDDALFELDEWATPEKPEPKKAVENFNPSAYVKAKPYLETIDDVEAFVTAVKEELLQLIKTHRVKVK